MGLLVSCGENNYQTEFQPTEQQPTAILSGSTVSRKAQLSSEAQLSQAQVRLLESLGLRIVIPSYVPPGFKLEKVEAELDHSSTVGGISYRIIYRKYETGSGKDFCFAIEATNGGIGDLPSGERSFPVNSSVLGKSTLEYGSYGQASNPTLLGNWLGPENGPFYRFVGAGVLPTLSRCDNISSQEAVRVTESLQYLP